ncbi:MAG: hypothetical protein J0L63_07890 [Anaerolineae bacterium]|nr:hypothetical protein [Anaerolineae bacterium]
MRRYILVSILVMVLAAVGIVQAQQINNFTAFVLDIRTDLEYLANEAIGEGQRPEGWTFNINDTGSPTYVADLWFDNEQLAAAIFGTERPQGWIGAPVTQDPAIVARNIRHDLELTANQVISPNTRPEAWQGGPALFQCERTVMNTVQVLRTALRATITTPEDAVNYCQTITNETQSLTLQLVLSTPEIEQTLPDLILAGRGDLERLADERLGLNARPTGWLGNKDRNSPTLLSDTYIDLESLGNELLGVGQRPDTWLGAPPTATIYAYRYLRFNLELLAVTVGQTPRPRGWQGTNPVESCDPTLQNLVSLAEDAYSFSTETLSEGTYCQQLSLAVNTTVENPPAPDENVVDESDLFESELAFSYLDQAATQYMGIMPPGTRFKPWYRNFGESTMMFVSGDDFALYVDRRWTTMPQDLFERLPTTEGVKPLTFCDASWCNGPGPTPTPTGSGALQALLNAGTPPAIPDIQQVEGEKTQVSWNYIRVTYLLDNAAARTAQVALEICSDTTQTDCEPVTQIFDNTIGTAKAVLSQFNGLNVYEFGYGYTSDLLIEGATRFSPDVWISDPTIR